MLNRNPKTFTEMALGWGRLLEGTAPARKADAARGRQGLLVESKLGADGQYYGILQENDGYYIKTARNEGTGVPAADSFAYIGGEVNRARECFASLPKAQRRVHLKLHALHESAPQAPRPNVDELLQQLDAVPAAPAPVEVAPAPEAGLPGLPGEDPNAAPGGDLPGLDADPNADPNAAPTGEDPNAAPGPEPEGDEMTPDKILSMVGKLGAALDKLGAQNLTPQITKAVLKPVVSHLEPGIKALDPGEVAEITDSIEGLGGDAAPAGGPAPEGLPGAPEGDEQLAEGGQLNSYLATKNPDVDPERMADYKRGLRNNMLKAPAKPGTRAEVAASQNNASGWRHGLGDAKQTVARHDKSVAETYGWSNDRQGYFWKDQQGRLTDKPIPAHMAKHDSGYVRGPMADRVTAKRDGAQHYAQQAGELRQNAPQILPEGDEQLDEAMFQDPNHYYTPEQAALHQGREDARTLGTDTRRGYAARAQQLGAGARGQMADGSDTERDAAASRARYANDESNIFMRGNATAAAAPGPQATGYDAKRILPEDVDLLAGAEQGLAEAREEQERQASYPGPKGHFHSDGDIEKMEREIELKKHEVETAKWLQKKPQHPFEKEGEGQLNEGANTSGQSQHQLIQARYAATKADPTLRNSGERAEQIRNDSRAPLQSHQAHMNHNLRGQAAMYQDAAGEERREGVAQTFNRKFRIPVENADYRRQHLASSEHYTDTAAEKRNAAEDVVRGRDDSWQSVEGRKQYLPEGMDDFDDSDANVSGEQHQNSEFADGFRSFCEYRGYDAYQDEDLAAAVLAWAKVVSAKNSPYDADIEGLADAVNPYVLEQLKGHLAPNFLAAIEAEVHAQNAPAAEVAPLNEGLQALLRGLVAEQVDFLTEGLSAEEKEKSFGHHGSKALKVKGKTVHDGYGDSKTHNRPQYSHYVVGDGKIHSGWETSDDAKDHAKEMSETGNVHKVYSGSHLKGKLAMDPDHNNHWATK